MLEREKVDLTCVHRAQIALS